MRLSMTETGAAEYFFHAQRSQCKVCCQRSIISNNHYVFPLRFEPVQPIDAVFISKGFKQKFYVANGQRI